MIPLEEQAQWYLRLLSILPNISGSISLLCSLVLLYMLFRSKQQIKIAQRRLIFGKGVADVLQSAWMTLSTLPAPETAHVWNPHGTQATCNAQGFSIFFGTSVSLLYTSGLCIYYMCVIKYRMNETRMLKYEILFHAVPILWGLVGGLILLYRGDFKADAGWCWANGLMDRVEDNVESSVGRNIFTSSTTWIVTLPFIILFITICFSMLTIFLLFHSEERQRQDIRNKREESRRKEEEARRRREETMINEPPLSECSSLDSDTAYDGIYRANSGGDRMHLGFLEDPTGSRSHELIRQSGLRRASPANNRRNAFDLKGQFVIHTAFRYIAAYFCAFLFSFILVILSHGEVSSDIFKVCWALAIFCYPLQGCFNFIVYFQPKFVAVRKNNVRHTFLQAFFQTIDTDGESARRPNIRQLGQSAFKVKSDEEDQSGGESETGAITNDSPFLQKGAGGSVASKISVPKYFERGGGFSAVSDSPLPNNSNPLDSRESIESISNEFEGSSSQDFSDGIRHHEYDPSSSTDSQRSQCHYQSSSSSAYSQSSSVEMC